MQNKVSPLLIIVATAMIAAGGIVQFSDHAGVTAETQAVESRKALVSELSAKYPDTKLTDEQIDALKCDDEGACYGAEVGGDKIAFYGTTEVTNPHSKRKENVTLIVTRDGVRLAVE